MSALALSDLPAHAHVPGLTPRHADGAFDGIVRGVEPGAAPEALAETVAFRTGVAWLGAGYFWEAHEVLEPVWMACRPNAPERLFLRALIQIANAGLKRRMGRTGAVARLEAEAGRLLAECPGMAVRFGLEPAAMAALWQAARRA